MEQGEVGTHFGGGRYNVGGFEGLMARGTIKDQHVGVEICDVCLEGDASKLALGACPTFEDHRIGHSDVCGAAVKDVDLVAVADGELPCFGEFAATKEGLVR